MEDANVFLEYYQVNKESEAEMSQDEEQQINTPTADINDQQYEIIGTIHSLTAIFNAIGYLLKN